MFGFCFVFYFLFGACFGCCLKGQNQDSWWVCGKWEKRLKWELLLEDCWNGQGLPSMAKGAEPYGNGA